MLRTYIHCLSIILSLSLVVVLSFCLLYTPLFRDIICQCSHIFRAAFNILFCTMNASFSATSSSSSCSSLQSLGVHPICSSIFTYRSRSSSRASSSERLGLFWEPQCDRGTGRAYHLPFFHRPTIISKSFGRGMIFPSLAGFWTERVVSYHQPYEISFDTSPLDTLLNPSHLSLPFPSAYFQYLTMPRLLLR